jgi:hypothetical protein
LYSSHLPGIVMPANNLLVFKSLSVTCQCCGTTVSILAWGLFAAPTKRSLQPHKKGRQVYAQARKNARQVPDDPLPSTLPLFVAGLGADHADHAVALDDLALAANALNRCSHFHWYISS